MSYSQEGTSTEKRDSKVQINETLSSTAQVVPKLTLGLSNSQELNGSENMNESGDKLNQIENVAEFFMLFKRKILVKLIILRIS